VKLVPAAIDPQYRPIDSVTAATLSSLLRSRLIALSLRIP